MKSLLLTPLLLVLTFSPSFAQNREFRDLTSTDGKTVHAELLGLTPDGILKVRVNFKPFEIPLHKLSDSDREWIQTWDAQKKNATPPDDGYSRLIFADDFSGETFDPRWGHYKSGSIIQDGVLVGITPSGSDHAAVDNIRFDPEQDLQVSVKFRFVSEQARSLNVWFDDKAYKGSHAGHICNVNISPTFVTIADAKTGNMENAIYERKKSPQGLTEQDKTFLLTKTTRVPTQLSLGEWHTLLIRTRGDLLEVHLNGKPAASFQSEGIAHETKSLVSLTTNEVDVHYDDFSLKAPAK